MNRRLPSPSAATRYTLQITGDIARQLSRCRASIRQTIERKLGEIAAAAGGQVSTARAPVKGGPPLRFYVFEGYRVSYAIRPGSRTVAVLEIRSDPG